MITLHQFPAGWGLPSYSPFCVKLETWLRLTGLAYEVVVEIDPRKGPKNKLPYVVDDGEVIADSGLIIERLTAKHGVDPDAGLDARQRAVAHALRRTAEESLYWSGIVYPRWAVDANWRTVKPAYFASIPPVVRALVAALARRDVRRQLRGQGIGWHGPGEIYAMGRRDVDAFAAVLGDRPFLMGAAPTTVDATGYAFLAAILDVPIDTPVRARIQQSEPLTAYWARMRERCFPETVPETAG